MSEMEERLSALLGNPQLMEQIASMAQAMNAQEQQPETTAQPALDPRLIQALTKTMGSTGIDSNQSALLHALGPYLCSHRIQKLERAMRAARLAGAASAFLNSGGLQLITGR